MINPHTASWNDLRGEIERLKPALKLLAMSDDTQVSQLMMLLHISAHAYKDETSCEHFENAAVTMFGAIKDFRLALRQMNSGLEAME